MPSFAGRDYNRRKNPPRSSGEGRRIVNIRGICNLSRRVSNRHKESGTHKHGQAFRLHSPGFQCSQCLASFAQPRGKKLHQDIPGLCLAWIPTPLIRLDLLSFQTVNHYRFGIAAFININSFAVWAPPDVIFGQRNHPRFQRIAIADFIPFPVCVYN